MVMKKLYILAVLALAVACSPAEQFDYPYVTANRSCWFKGLVPENSIEGVRMAARFGYPAIECDVKYTLDSVMVLMHDATINRTMRNASDYSKIEEPVKVTETLFEDLRTKYVLASSDPSLRTPLPTLEEQLDACLEYGVTPMLHSKVPESYTLAQAKMGDNWVCFSAEYDKVLSSRDFSKCLVLWDPGYTPADQTAVKLEAIGQPCGMSSMKNDVVDAQYIKTIRDAGYEVQSSIWKTPHEMRAVHDGASIILSDWCWFQTEGRTPAQKSSARKTKLNAGESITLTFPKEEFSAMVLDVTYTGTLEITLNSEKTYTFTHETSDSEHIGLRMHDTEPTIVLKAVDDCFIDSYLGRFYKI